MPVFYISFKTLRYWAGGAICLVILAAGLFGDFYFVHRFTEAAAGQKLKPVYSVDVGADKRCALSFDAAWGATRTGRLMDTLESRGLYGTFFLTNIWMDAYPEMTAEIARRGHEIGLHSSSHPDMTQLSAADMLKEIDDNRSLAVSLTGQTPGLFRPPFGAYNSRVVQTLMDQGLVPVQWSVDSLDWKESLSADEIYGRVVKGIRPGAIVLFHNDGQFTPEVLERLLTYLEQEGYSVEKVGELLLDGPWTVDSQGVQRSPRENL
ncbi:MAG: polysaccharide deacetylase family protein [Peptococcaceae bacterium]|jgi:peptidoglycan/xylan/chitin deacetylase (PgdA/CDA1 family)|nr:polysaccharide deacetylase family protein [Peptococcaceae bacterium]